MTTSVDVAPGEAPDPAAPTGRPEAPSSSFVDRHFWLLVGGLLLFAFLVRAGYVLHTQGFALHNDDKSYDYLARTLAAGHGWGYSGSAYRPPGYPVFLAVVYLIIGTPHGHWTAARLVEAVVSAFAVGLIGWLALQIAGRRAALISMAVGAIYVPLVLVGVSLMTESLFVPLMLLAVNCALRSREAQHRYRWVLAAGLFTGLASLTRGNGLVLAIALLPLVLGRPWRSWRALSAPALLLVLTALVISPWTIRNAGTQHAFVPVTTELGPTLAGTYNGLSAKTRYVWHIKGFPYQYPSIAREAKRKHLTGAEVDQKLTKAVLRYIANHPQALPEAMFWNTMRLLDLQGRRVSRMTARTDEEASARWADYGVVAFWILGALALIGLALGVTRGTPGALWVVPLLLWLSIAPVTTGTPRFRAALDPFIILVAAMAVERLTHVVPERLRSRAGRRPAAAASA